HSPFSIHHSACSIRHSPFEPRLRVQLLLPFCFRSNSSTRFWRDTPPPLPYARRPRHHAFILHPFMLHPFVLLRPPTRIPHRATVPYTAPNSPFTLPPSPPPGISLPPI